MHKISINYTSLVRLFAKFKKKNSTHARSHNKLCSLLNTIKLRTIFVNSIKYYVLKCITLYKIYSLYMPKIVPPLHTLI